MTLYALEVKDPERAVVAHWAKVPWLAKAEKITFKPGINIVFGPNGSGKSTLIHALAMLKHCKGSGLPVVTESSIKDFRMGFGDKDLRDGLVLRCDDEICRFASPDLRLARYAGMIDDDFGFEQMRQMFAQKHAGHASSGEKMIGEIARIAFAEGVEVEFKYGATKKDFSHSPAAKKLYALATKALTSKGRKTVERQTVMLFDEVERSMDFVNEAVWWDKIEHARINGGIQVILATHSPFALAMDENEVNFIETEPGYIEKARKAMERAGWTRTSSTT